MNAYEVLGLEIPTFDSEDTDYTIKTMDELVADKLNIKYRELIEKLREILERGVVLDENGVEAARDIWLEYCECNRAYAHIKSDESRKKYQKMDKIPIEEEAKKFFEDAKQKVLFARKNSRDDSISVQDAFSILTTTPNSEITDRDLRRRLSEFLNFSVGRNTPKNMKSDEYTNILRKVMKYLWAYTQLETKENRNVYAYKLAIANRYREITTELKMIENGGMHRSRVIDQITLEGTKESEEEGEKAQEGDGQTIVISKRNQILFGSFMIPNEGYVNQYIINLNGKDYYIYGDLDFDRMRDDPSYVKRLKKSLLTPGVMSCAEEELGGYVGGLDQNGKLVIDPEKAAACIKYQREVERQQKRKNGELDGQDPNGANSDGR